MSGRFLPRLLAAGIAALAAAPALAAEAGGAGMPQLNFNDYAPQLAWLAISFTVLYLLMARVALPRIGEVLSAREERIANDLDRAAALKSEAEDVMAAYEKSLAEAHGRANETVRQTEAAIARDTAARQAELNQELGSRIKDAEGRIAQAKAAAMAGLQTVAGEAARAAVERLIGTKVASDDSERAAAAALAQRRAAGGSD